MDHVFQNHHFVGLVNDNAIHLMKIFSLLTFSKELVNKRKCVVSLNFILSERSRFIIFMEIMIYFVLRNRLYDTESFDFRLPQKENTHSSMYC